MKLTDEQCATIVSQLYKSGKRPAARISADWKSYGGRIGQFSHQIMYGSSRPKELSRSELYSKFGYCDVIVEIKIPGTYGWNGNWIAGSTEYSTDLDDVIKNCDYSSGVHINIWKVPRTIIRKLEKETPAEDLESISENTKVTLTFGQLSRLVKESLFRD